MLVYLGEEVCIARESRFWLQSVSVMVTAEYHNPSILNPDFLKFQGIVPENGSPP